MHKKPFLMKLIVCVLPIFAAALVYIFKNYIYNLSTHFPACPIYNYFGIYCPGCGNTRSVQNLLNGDMLGSLKYNITPVFFIIVGAFAYLELIFYIFGLPARILPRNKRFWAVVIFIFLLYFIIRNFIPLY
ncbi:uncharacterized protein DUF2752 [Ruminiclostridium sufflavum DSM 19573]|uniref:Uncharacterized protein DUF2752 n=1 Tax=Ruminiclostridium sufflavum DSM 19573 TaxID=1121337 RepID=A0A318XLQ6_9FIRM|nr:uncharacterized protein DUF2752 [Ruminiclostridium sufflavum DSM 19573]